MKKIVLISACGGAALLLCASMAVAQNSYVQHFRSHNTSMTSVQPSWISPLVEADPRLLQYVRLSFSNEYTAAGTQTTNYLNGKGFGVIAGNRYEFDFMPPSYFQHNSKAYDGFGDASTLVKYRIVSRNADHGNYIVTAMLSHSFTTGSYSNGAVTSTYTPTLAGGIGINRHFQVESSLGGLMPTGKIATQGRTIIWNALIQTHATKHFWGELENNATFYNGGAHDGKMQNFITPAAFYVLRRPDWKPTHPFFIFDTGMQIATSSYHSYNHNLISEVRVLF